MFLNVDSYRKLILVLTRDQHSAKYDNKRVTIKYIISSFDEFFTLGHIFATIIENGQLPAQSVDTNSIQLEI